MVARHEALSVLANELGHSGPERYMLGQIAAVSVGIVDGQIVCDLDYENNSQAEVDMNVVKRDENLVEVQGTGEKGAFTRIITETLQAQRMVLGA